MCDTGIEKHPIPRLKLWAVDAEVEVRGCSPIELDRVSRLDIFDLPSRSTSRAWCPPQHVEQLLQEVGISASLSGVRARRYLSTKAVTPCCASQHATLPPSVVHHEKVERATGRDDDCCAVATRRREHRQSRDHHIPHHQRRPHSGRRRHGLLAPLRPLGRRGSSRCCLLVSD